MKYVVIVVVVIASHFWRLHAPKPRVNHKDEVIAWLVCHYGGDNQLWAGRGGRALLLVCIPYMDVRWVDVVLHRYESLESKGVVNIQDHDIQHTLSQMTTALVSRHPLWSLIKRSEGMKGQYVSKENPPSLILSPSGHPLSLELYVPPPGRLPYTSCGLVCPAVPHGFPRDHIDNKHPFPVAQQLTPALLSLIGFRRHAVCPLHC